MYIYIYIYRERERCIIHVAVLEHLGRHVENMTN